MRNNGLPEDGKLVFVPVPGRGDIYPFVCNFDVMERLD
jgi:hypothetical protein